MKTISGGKIDSSIKEVLKKWFNEMGVVHSDILFSNADKDLTAGRIKQFFDYVPE